MRAELIIEHEEGDLLGALTSTFGEHDASALENSTLARTSPESARTVTYAGVAPGLVVLAWPTSGYLYLFVESSGGRWRRSASSVWDLIRTETRPLRPKLKSLVLLDEVANDEVVEARVGLLPNLRRPELLLTFATGVVSGVWLVIALAAFGSTGGLILGAIPALSGAILALVSLVIDVRSQSLVWK